MSIATARSAGANQSVDLVPTATSLQSLANTVRGSLRSAAGIRLVNGAVRVDLGQAAELMNVGTVAISWGTDVQRYVRNRTSSHDAEDVTTSKEILAALADDVRDLIEGCRLLPLLDEHQVRNVALMTIANSPGACIFDEQGTGKTISVVAAFDLLVERNDVDVLLVVAPKSMVGEWGAEIARFTNNGYKVETLDGSKATRAQALRSGADVFVCNYETLIAIPEDIRLLCQRTRVVLAADESFNVKNPRASRTAALISAREWCVRAFALCGTPAPNAAADIVAQVSLVDMGRAFNGVHLSIDVDKQSDQIREVIESKVVYSRNLKLTVLPDLPGRTFTEVSVELSTDQKILYETIADELVTDLKNVSDQDFSKSYSNYLARRSALLRLCSDPSAVDPQITSPSAKLLALDGLLARWMVQGEKVVIWSFYRATLDALESRYSHFGLVRIDGSITDVSARRAAVKSFQTSPETRIFLGNPAAAGAGITLHSAAVSVYESMSNQAAHYLQSLDRTHRRGQSRAVEYVALLSAGTIEWDEYERLHRKAAMQADLLGDPSSQAFTRGMMLDELLASLDALSRAQ